MSMKTSIKRGNLPNLQFANGDAVQSLLQCDNYGDVAMLIARHHSVCDDWTHGAIVGVDIRDGYPAVTYQDGSWWHYDVSEGTGTWW